MTVSVLSHFLEWGPVWFWMRTKSPTLRGWSHFVCSVQRSAARICRFLNASSLAAKVSRQVLCGLYFPGRMGIKSRIGLPKTHRAGESLMSLFGVLRYWKIARWNLSVFRSPLGPVLSISNCFTVFTPISALQLLWGKATEEIL